jgi:hypothetical protein
MREIRKIEHILPPLEDLSQGTNEVRGGVPHSHGGMDARECPQEEAPSVALLLFHHQSLMGPSTVAQTAGGGRRGWTGKEAGVGRGRARIRGFAEDGQRPDGKRNTGANTEELFRVELSMMIKKTH